MDFNKEQKAEAFVETESFKECEKAVNKYDKVIIEGIIHAGLKTLHKKLSRSNDSAFHYIEYDSKEFNRLDVDNNFVLFATDYYIEHYYKDFKKKIISINYSITKNEAKYIAINHIKRNNNNIIKSDIDFLKKKGFFDKLIDHATFEKSVVPSILIKKIDSYLSGKNNEFFHDEGAVKTIINELEKITRNRNLLMGTLGLEILASTTYALELAKNINDIVKGVPIIGLAIPLALIGVTTYEFMSGKKEPKQNYYDKLAAAGNHWKNISEEEREIIGYLCDKKNSLKPGDGKKKLDEMFFNDEAIKKNIDKIKDEIENILKNNAYIRKIIESNINELENLRQTVIEGNKKYEEIEKKIGFIESQQNNLSEKVADIEDKLESLEGADIIENDDFLKEKLGIQDKIIYDDEIENIVNKIKDNSFDKFVFITGEGGIGKTTLLYQVGEKLLNEGNKVYIIRDISEFSFFDFFKENAFTLFDINNQSSADKLFEELNYIGNNKDICLSRIIIASREGFVKNHLNNSKNIKIKESSKEFPLRHSNAFIKNLVKDLFKNKNLEDKLIEKLLEKADYNPFYVRKAYETIKDSKDKESALDDLPKGVKELLYQITYEEINNDPFNIIVYYLVSNYPFFPIKLYEELLSLGEIKEAPKHISSKSKIHLHPGYADVINEIINDNYQEKIILIKRDARLKNIKENLSEIKFPENDFMDKFKTKFSEFIKNLGNSDFVPIIDIIDSFMILSIRNFVKNNFNSEEDIYGIDIFTKRLNINNIEKNKIPIYNYVSDFIINSYLDKNIFEDLQSNKRHIYSLSILFISRLLTSKTLDVIENNIFGEKFELDFNFFLNYLLLTKIAENKYITFLCGIMYAIKYFKNSLLNQANFLFCFGDYDQAIELYDESIKKEPNNFNAYFYKGLSCSKIGRHSEAMSSIDKAIEIDPENSKYYYQKTKLLLRLNRYDEALSSIDKAIEIEPENSKYYQQKVFIFLQMNEPAKVVMPSIDKCIELNPQHSAYYSQKINILLKSDKAEEALPLINKSINFNPLNSGYYIQKAYILMKLKNHAEALSSVNKAIEIDPENNGYFYQKANILMQLNNYEEALSSINKAIEIDPENNGYFYQKANILMQLNNTAEALSFINKAIENDPENSIYYCQKAIILKSNNPAEALSLIHKAIKLNPKYSGNYYHKANILLELNNPLEALTSIDTAIKLNPKNSDYYIQKVNIIDKAIKMNPKNSDYYIQKAFILLRLSRNSEALDSINEAIIIDPKNSRNKRVKANILHQLKNN